MYNVNKIYIEQRNHIAVYNPDEISPSELANRIGVNVKIFVSVYNSDSKKSVALNYSKLVTDYEPMEVSDWKTFDKQLTDALVLGYTVKLPGYVPGTMYPTNPIKIWDTMSSINTFDIQYCDYLSGRANIFAIRWKLKDLSISIADKALDYPNLKRCIPIVNGFACRPVYREEDNKLYALDGSHLCWHNGLHTTPEVQLLDFTSIGDYHCESIHTEKHTLDTCTYAYSTDGMYNFSLINENYSLYEWTPIISIGGMLIFPDEYEIKSEYQLTINLDRFPLNKALALKKFLQNEPDCSSDISYTSIDPKTYALEQFNTALSKDTFIIYLHISNLCTTRTKLTSWRKSITVDLNTTEGLLLNDATHIVKNYHKDTLPDRKELTIQAYENIFVTDDNFDKDQTSFVKPDCYHHTFEDLNKSTVTLLSLLGGV